VDDFDPARIDDRRRMARMYLRAWDGIIDPLNVPDRDGANTLANDLVESHNAREDLDGDVKTALQLLQCGPRKQAGSTTPRSR
jgi:hypothetical protein